MLEAVDVTSRNLSRMTVCLTEAERSDFALELLDALRYNVGDVHKVMRSWTATILVRSHPDFELQAKEYENLVRSNELFQGTEMELQPS